jgi:uncharacterized protein (TIGR03437 family)
MGQTDPPLLDGSINDGQHYTPNNQLSLSMNGHTVFPDVLYAGPAPAQVAAITQINFRVPDLPLNDYYLALGSGGDEDYVTVSIGK